MIAEIRRCLSRRAFVPSPFYSADRTALHGPTVDHAAVSPNGNRVIVFLDDATAEHLFPSLITRVSVDELHT
jgi:hypothetical protein